ncbi:hypothetical protein [Vibrio phage P23]|nr:hypothetical protein [Vibrio phage P23]
MIKNFLNRVIPGTPQQILTGDSWDTGRLRVDVGQTGFWEGREFRLDIEVSAPIVYKFSSPVNFILQFQTLLSHDGISTFTAYRAADGTEGGTFTGDGIANFPNNAMSDAPAYVQQTVITKGGTFAPTGTPVPREFIKSRAATATAQQTTIGGSAIQERGLPPGDYYLVFTGTDASYRLVYEERP